MIMLSPEACLILYIIAGFLTAGYYWNTHSKYDWADDRAMGTFFAGVFWWGYWGFKLAVKATERFKNDE